MKYSGDNRGTGMKGWISNTILESYGFVVLAGLNFSIKEEARGNKGESDVCQKPGEIY